MREFKGGNAGQGEKTNSSCLGHYRFYSKTVEWHQKPKKEDKKLEETQGNKDP